MLDFSMEPFKKEMIETLKGFIKIESVKSDALPNMPYGKGIFDALMYIQSTAERMDLDCVNLFGHLCYVDYGEGDEMLGILTHVDIVPEGDEWTIPAFEGVEKDGRIYGRGAIDDKGPAIAALYAIKALSDNCMQLGKKVRLIFGADEETTWTDMEYYKQHEQIPDVAFSPDGEYPIINVEKGVLHIELTMNCAPTRAESAAILAINAGTRVNVVPNRASCVIRAPFELIQKSISAYTCPIGATLSCKAENSCVRINASGRCAHGSKPEQGINAIAALLQYLNTLPLAMGDAENAVYTLAGKIGTTLHGENVQLDLSDEMSGRLTLNLGTLSLQDGVLKAGLDVRYPVSFTQTDIETKIKEQLGMFEYRCAHALNPLYVPEDSELIKTLGQVYKDNTGNEPYCLAIGGATYARAFKNAVTFGPLFPGQPCVEHGPDEYIEIDSLIKNAQIIADAIVRLCGCKS
jgi:succinyl-diaminopimelate desuccinylase